MSGDPMQMKLDQALHLMEDNSFVSIRNMALSLCQCFSISRYNEILYWRLGIMSTFAMSASLPTTRSTDIVLILMAQKMKKGKVVLLHILFALHRTCV